MRSEERERGSRIGEHFLFRAVCKSPSRLLDNAVRKKSKSRSPLVSCAGPDVAQSLNIHILAGVNFKIPP